mgnify:CR=1 FL=1
MLRIGMDEVVIEEVVELVEDYFEDWDSVVEAIEDYAEERKESGIFDKGKTWLMITLIATLLGITTSEVLANPNENVEKLVKLYQQDISGIEDAYAVISVKTYQGNPYYFVAFDKKITDLETKKALAKAKLKLQHAIENPVFVSETQLGLAFAEDVQDADVLRTGLEGELKRFKL